MSNKTQLSNNNTKLASLIQELQGKAAGGGSTGVETLTGIIYGSTTLGGGSSKEVAYIDENQTPRTVVVENHEEIQITVAKGTLLVGSNEHSSMWNVTNVINAELIPFSLGSMQSVCPVFPTAENFEIHL